MIRCKTVPCKVKVRLPVNPITRKVDWSHPATIDRLNDIGKYIESDEVDVLWEDGVEYDDEWHEDDDK